jgi:pilus assembly protein CpaB
MRRPTIFLMLAMVAAVLAAIVVFSALRNREAQTQLALAQTEQIVVAARDVQVGAKLSIDDVKLIRWSRQSIPQGAFTDPSAVANSYAKSALIDGEPIVQRLLISADRIPGVMPMMITPGMRAMSVAVDEISDIAGFVKPHTRVDVLVAVSGTGADTKPFSKIVLQNIEVLAVAQQIEKGKDEAEVAKVVTLLVTPHQAEKLGLAGREGTLRLAMRNYNDDKMIATTGSDFTDLLGPSATTVALGSAQPLAVAQIAPVMRVRGGGNSLGVEVMRDGKNDETVSFIAGGARRSHRESEDQTPPPASEVTPPPAAAPQSAPAAVPTAAPSIGAAEQAAPASGAVAAAYMPVPKTLEVP